MGSSVLIHVVDDEEPVRRSMAFLLTASGYAVRVHDSAVAFLKDHPYPAGNCLVTDLRMPEMDGVQLLKHMQQSGHTLPTIVVTGHGDVPMAVSAMKYGAIDFIEKPFEDSVLLDAIARAVEKAADAHESSRSKEAALERFNNLSERERQVFDGIVAGKANKVIALERDLSPRTVEVYRANVMSKMQARTLPELVRMALSLNIPVDSDEASKL